MKAEFNIDLESLTEEITAKIVKALQRQHTNCKAQDDQLFTVKSLAEYLAVSDQWVYERIQRHEIPVLKVGKFPRFKKSDIEKWLDTLKTPAMNVLSSRLKITR